MWQKVCTIVRGRSLLVYMYIRTSYILKSFFYIDPVTYVQTEPDGVKSDSFGRANSKLNLIPQDFRGEQVHTVCTCVRFLRCLRKLYTIIKFIRVAVMLRRIPTSRQM